MSTVPTPPGPPVPAEPPAAGPAVPARPPILPRQAYTVAVPYRWRGPRRGVLVGALVVAVVLLVGSVGASVAWAHSAGPAVPARFGIERFGDPDTGGDWMGGHMPGNHHVVPQVPGSPERPVPRPGFPGRPVPTPSPAPTR